MLYGHLYVFLGEMAFFDQVVCLLHKSCINRLYILEINYWLVASFANIFPHSVGCLFEKEWNTAICHPDPLPIAYFWLSIASKWCLFVIFFCFRLTSNLYSVNFRLWNLVPLTIFHAVFAQNSLWGICLKTLLIWSHVSSSSWFLPFVYATLGSWPLHLFLLLIYL